jgi:hypothetical protein
VYVVLGAVFIVFVLVAIAVAGQGEDVAVYMSMGSRPSMFPLPTGGGQIRNQEGDDPTSSCKSSMSLPLGKGDRPKEVCRVVGPGEGRTFSPRRGTLVLALQG